MGGSKGSKGSKGGHKAPCYQEFCGDSEAAWWQHDVLARLPHVCPKLKVLNLSDQGLYAPGHSALAGATPKLPFLRQLTLVNTHISSEVAKLCKALLWRVEILKEALHFLGPCLDILLSYLPKFSMNVDGSLLNCP